MSKSVVVGDVEVVEEPRFRTPYNYDKRLHSLSSGLRCMDKSLTQQQFMDDSNPNEIMRRFKITGQMPTNLRTPVYGDYDGIFDFQTAQNSIVAAQQSFAALPAKIRDRFGNNPQTFLEFCTDEENNDELIRMGLRKKPVEVVAPAVAAPVKPEAKPGA